MPVPATNGQLRNNIRDMSVGDYIYGFYEKSGAGWGIGMQKGTEYPITGVPASSFDTGFFYYIKVDIGLLVADRVIQHTQSWETLNGSSKVIQGRPEIFGGVSGTFRSLTGGAAYADTNGNMSLTDQGFGAWPTNNEWDKYIVSFPSNKIQTGNVLDDVFHWKSTCSWCQETVINGLAHHTTTSTIGNNTHRIWRGTSSGLTGTFRNEANYGNFSASTTSANLIGFRPVFEYKEV